MNAQQIILYSGNAPVLPTVEITFPLNGSEVVGVTQTITGTAASALSTVTLVEVNINGAGWVSATGTDTWSYEATLPLGAAISIQARATGSLGRVSNVFSITTDVVAMVFDDAFTESNGVSIVAGTADTDLLDFPWLLNIADMQVTSNRARATGTDATVTAVRYVGVSDGTIYWDYGFNDIYTAGTAGPKFYFRWKSDLDHWYISTVLALNATHTWTVVSVENGTPTTRGSGTFAALPVEGTIYEMKAVLSGTSIKCYRGGILFSDLTSSIHQTAKWIGFEFYKYTLDAGSGTWDMEMDRVRVTASSYTVPATPLKDLMTDSDGVAIESHDPDIAGEAANWTLIAGAGEINTNRFRATILADNNCQVEYDSAVSEIFTESDLYWKTFYTPNASAGMFMLARKSDSTHYWQAHQVYQDTTPFDRLVLYRRDGGAAVEMGSIANDGVIAAGVTSKLTFYCVGSRIMCWAMRKYLIAVTDTANQTNTKVLVNAMRFADGGGTWEVDRDNVVVRDMT